MPGPTQARVRPLLFTRSLAQKKRGCGCCSCLCRILSLLLILLVIIGITAVILYFVFHPKVPKYSVDQLRISDLKLNPDLSLYAKFKVRITAYNPNDKIGIHYEKGGKMSVWYGSNELCKGRVPSFYQGHRDRRVINVDLTGKNKYGSILMAALQRQAGNIPLHLKVNMPVAVELGSLKLRTVRFLVSCLLVVDSISANNLISIRTSQCRFGVKF